MPLSLGDSHHGFAVLGTDAGYFEQFKYADRQPLVLAQGRRFEAVFEVVIGAGVAQQRGYRLGQVVVLSHGDGAIEANEHADKPFTVTGILARTGTPVDRSLLVSLQALEAVHLDWASVARLPVFPCSPGLPGAAVSAGQAVAADLTPTTVTAALVGLKDRAAVFAVQRDVAAFRDEPLLAILPGVALDELWQVVALGECGLQAVSVLVAIVSLAGRVAVILAGLNGRRRELAILRAVDAGPRQVLLLLALEGALVTSAGVALGAAACWGAVAALGPRVQAQFGITLRLQSLSNAEWSWLASLLAAGLWPACCLAGAPTTCRCPMACRPASDTLAPPPMPSSKHLSRRPVLLQAGAVMLAVLLPTLGRAQPLPKPGPDGFTELRWDDLMPKGWDPMKGLRDKGINPGALVDGDPKTQELMRELRESWDYAPTEPTLDGARIKLPGYLVPLDEGAAGLTAFLLVPYFGACIHTPPPPANQIVWVVPAKPAAGFRSMDTVWVSGTLTAQRGDAAMGSTGYRLDAQRVERYKATPR